MKLCLDIRGTMAVSPIRPSGGHPGRTPSCPPVGVEDGHVSDERVAVGVLGRLRVPARRQRVDADVGRVVVVVRHVHYDGRLGGQRVGALVARLHAQHVDGRRLVVHRAGHRQQPRAPVEQERVPVGGRRLRR